MTGLEVLSIFLIIMITSELSEEAIPRPASESAKVIALTLTSALKFQEDFTPSSRNHTKSHEVTLKKVANIVRRHMKNGSCPLCSVCLTLLSRNEKCMRV